MDITAPPEPEVLRRGLEEVRRRLPPGWKVSGPRGSRKDRRTTGAGPAFQVRLTGPDGNETELVVDVKGDGSTRTIGGAIKQFRAREGKSDSLLLAPFLPMRSRELAASEGMNYADLTGNLRLVLRRPALFLQDRGDEKNPFPGKRVERGLAGAAAGRLVLWLCQLALPVTTGLLTGVAKDSNVSLSYVSRLVDLLEREDLVRRKPRGPIEAVDRPGLVRRWAEDYSLLGSNQGRLYLDPRGAENALEGMRAKAFQRRRFAVSGSFAARRYAPISTPSKLVCFVEDPDEAAEALELSPATGTGNVFLLSPYDPVVFREVRNLGTEASESSIRFAPTAQVAVDCLTGTDRMPEEGAALLAWLKKNRPGWEGLRNGVRE